MATRKLVLRQLELDMMLYATKQAIGGQKSRPYNNKSLTWIIKRLVLDFRYVRGIFVFDVVLGLMVFAKDGYKQKRQKNETFILHIFLVRYINLICLSFEIRNTLKLLATS